MNHCPAMRVLREAQAAASSPLDRLNASLASRAHSRDCPTCKAVQKALDRITFPGGELDEVCLTDVAFFHLERMDDGAFWLGLTDAEGHTLHINLATRRGAYIVGRVMDEGAWPDVPVEGEDSDKPWEPR